MEPSTSMASTSMGARAPPGGVSCATASRQELSECCEMIAMCSGLRSMLRILRGQLRRLSPLNTHTPACLVAPGPLSSTASHCPLSDKAINPPWSVILYSVVTCEQAALKRQHNTLPLQIRPRSVSAAFVVELNMAGGMHSPSAGPVATLSFSGSSCCGWPVGQTMTRFWTTWPSFTSRKMLMVPSSGFTAIPRTTDWTRNCVRFSFQTIRLWLRLYRPRASSV
mmetsp:Transcript_102097/g.304754  ORF Transcript_102097/g.304754 Transcript_102097/m.304754 type:complete len:224 (+) Transcript_102097:403-1074(+)